MRQLVKLPSSGQHHGVEHGLCCGSHVRVTMFEQETVVVGHDI